MTLAALDALLAGRRRTLEFPGWLETRFDRETARKRQRGLARDSFTNIVVYNLFMIGDLLLAPDTIRLSAFIHLLVVTPALLAIFAILRRGGPQRLLLRDLLGAAIPLLMVAQILTVFCVTRSESVAHYPYFVVLTVMCSNSAMRLSYRSALWASQAAFVMTSLTLVATHRIPASVAVMIAISLAASARLTLMSAFAREFEFRRAWVQELRDRLRVELVDNEARRDALTGLANRRRLDEAGAALWAEGAQPVAVVLFDIDRFKTYNDRYGHLAGDACLRRVAAAAAACFEDTNVLLARYGGEEFVAVLPGSDLEAAAEMADRLRRAIADLGIPHPGPAGALVVTASFGVAAGETGAISFEALLAGADSALYVAKRAGRNCVSTQDDSAGGQVAA